MTVNLQPGKALIFRIVHAENVPWILEHGLHCRNSPDQDPSYVNIGSADLIDKRSRRRVPVPPGGTLSDYVPFYFTPFSIMMYNIKTGYGNITRRENRDIVMFVSSVPKLEALGLTYVFTNQHAYHVDTDFYDSLSDLDKIDWALLQSRNFKTNDADPGRQLRYQAEALLGMGCHNDEVKARLEAQIAARGKNLSVKTTPSWYF